MSTIGDIDLAVATKNPKKAVNHFLSFPQIKKIIDKGEKKVSVKLKTGQQLDIRFHSPNEFGALLQHFTGSKNHNIRLRQLAQQKHLSLSEYGIKKGNKTQKFSQEKDFYQALGLDWIPPELREDLGEIEAAQTHQLPNLVKLSDIKGDLHVHTDFHFKTSHDLGIDSMKTLVKTAKHLNYQYLGFADHNPSFSSYSSKQIIDVLKARKATIDKFKSSSENKVKILNSLEVDIKPDGKLAVPDQGLDQLDFAIVAVHSSFKQSKKITTQRVLTALSHPQAKILAHPASRKINHRPAIDLDWDKLFDFCEKNHKILEINAWPDRLDLPDTLVHQAIKTGLKLVINTDAHAADQLSLMKYGVAVARRGWAESKNIINTLFWPQLKSILRIK
jgi:DNA polymerase (family 10)